MYIPRSIAGSIKKALNDSRKIVILYGARQVGKTTLIKKILEEIPGRILNINVDEKPYADLLASRDLSKLKLLVDGYDLVFIDEAQRVLDIGINLKIMHDQIPSLRIIASGSSSFELANRIQEPLTGRTKTFHLYPLAYDELLEIYNPVELDFQLDTLLTYGLYPEVVTLGNQKDKHSYLRELTSAYLYKDVLEITSIKHARRLSQLLQLLAYQVGSQVSLSELGQQLQMSKDTVRSYMDLLEKAFVIFRLSGFSRNLRKEVTKMDKVFFWDVGVRNAIIENFNLPDNRHDIGALWENFIISERLKLLSNNDQHARSNFWRTYTGAELDYVEEKNGQLHGYEIKWGKGRNTPPSSWVQAYPKADFSNITRENYMSFISGKH